jgi:hypothetical protein
MLGMIYVWHGKGSLKSERAAALNHAHHVNGAKSQLVEVRQGKEDETFWMVILHFFPSTYLTHCS